MQDARTPSHPSADKRRYPRTPSHVPIHYQISHHDAWVQGQGHMESLDLGAGGMRIRADDELQDGGSLYLQIPLADGPVFVLGHVAWSRREGDGYVGGIEFQGLSEADRARLATSLEPAPPEPAPDPASPQA